MKKAWTRAALLANTVKDGACRIWKGAYSSTGGPVAEHKGKRIPVRKLLVQLSGKDVPDGAFVGRVLACPHKGCICEAHIAVRSHSEHMRAASLRQESTMTSLANRRIAARRRGKLTTEQARAIRMESGTLHEIGSRYGVSMQTVSRIKRGVMWKEAASPFAGGAGRAA